MPKFSLCNLRDTLQSEGFTGMLGETGNKHFPPLTPYFLTTLGLIPVFMLSFPVLCPISCVCICMPVRASLYGFF